MTTGTIVYRTDRQAVPRPEGLPTVALPTRSSSHPPTWPAVVRSAALTYVRLEVLAVAAIFALFGGVQLVATRQDSALVAGLVGTVLLCATFELVAPGSITRDTLPPRLARLAAAVPVGITWLALAVVILPAGGPAVAQALGSLRVLAAMAGVFLAFAVVAGVVRRDPYFVPAFRADR